MSRDDLVLESSETIGISLELYRRGKADFADCLIACSGRAAGCIQTLTFDRDAAKTAGMTLVS
jgi:predicted nucleic-acid-binding protein